MTYLDPQPRPLHPPVPTEMTEPFWEACARGSLIFQRCNACHAANFEPNEWCRRCLSADLRWEESSARGTVATWTVVWHAPSPEFVVPYAPAIVELDEGFRMLSSVVGCTTSELQTGMRVAVAFHADRDGLVLPYFEPHCPSAGDGRRATSPTTKESS